MEKFPSLTRFKPFVGVRKRPNGFYLIAREFLEDFRDGPYITSEGIRDPLHHAANFLPKWAITELKSLSGELEEFGKDSLLNVGLRPQVEIDFIDKLNLHRTSELRKALLERDNFRKRIVSTLKLSLDPRYGGAVSIQYLNNLIDDTDTVMRKYRHQIAQYRASGRS